jgi:aspartate/methionine/tyrosine aminotransferase
VPLSTRGQGFVSLVLALSDPGDEVVLLAPYYFSHYNALTVCGVTPVVVRCDEATLLPTGIDDVRRAFSARTKAVVLVSPGNPSGVVAPSPFVDSLVALCRASDVWLLSDEAYWEITYDGAECSTPRALQGVVKIYTMSKVYGMAGWRVGALLYPKELSVHLRKVQDTIPTHATMVSQVAAYHALADDSALLQERLQNFSSSRRCFVKHLTSVYSQVELPFVCGDGAFYFFLPVASGAEPADGIVDFLVRTSSVLVVPGSAFGLANYVRVSYGSVLPEDAEEAAQRLRTGLEAWFARNGSRGGAST